MIKLEVRCCCVPTKLLGWLAVPLYAVERREIVVALGPVNGFFDEGQNNTIRTVRLPIEMIRDFDVHGPDNYLAIKSNETPIEDLRKIQGFRENV